MFRLKEESTNIAKKCKPVNELYLESLYSKELVLFH